MDAKTCSKCGEAKALTDFYRKARAKDGLQPSCKDCHNVTCRKYVVANPDKRRETTRKWRETNKDQIAESGRSYREANAEKEKERHRRYALENPQKELEKQRRWAKANREKARERSRRWRENNPQKFRDMKQRRRAMETNNGLFEVSEKELKRLLSSPCVGCGVGDQIEVDHIIPVTRGGHYSIGNVQPLCRSCNASKNNKLMIEWRVWRDKLAGPSVGAA